MIHEKIQASSNAVLHLTTADFAYFRRKRGRGASFLAPLSLGTDWFSEPWFNKGFKRVISTQIRELSR